MLDHPGKCYNVSPFVDGRCKTPVEEIQAVVDGSISPEQAVKLRQCLAHIDELEAHRNDIEQEILLIAELFSVVLDFLYTVPGLDKNLMTAITILSVIDPDMSLFQSSKNLVS
jgi:transposase